MLRLARFFRTDIGVALLIALSWQIAMLFIGFILDPSQGLLGHTMHWDANWYRHIIEHGYSESGSPAAPAFYPLYPMLIKIFSVLTFGLISLEAIGLAINTLGLWLLLVALIKILDHFKISKTGKVGAIALLMSFPSAMFFHVFYTEALFIAIASWSYVFALRRQWWAVGILLAVLTASRLPSILFVLLCGLEYLRAHSWSIKKSLNSNILWFLLAPLGFIAYGAMLFFIRGDFLAMFSAYKATNDWTYQVFSLNIFQTIATSLIDGINGLVNNWAYEHLVNRLLPFASIAAVIASSIYVYVKRRSEMIPLAIFGVASVVMFTLNSNVVSVHRYALACIVMYIAAALFANIKKRLYILLATCIPLLALQTFLYYKFVANIFAG